MRLRHLRMLAAATALVVASGACSDEPAGRSILRPGERMPGGMTLTSTAFREGRPIPERHSCEGLNQPPPLRWTGTPAGTDEIALVIEDPDAPGQIFVHWIVVGIDPGVTELRGAALPPSALVLPGSSDNPTYIGPCPPDGGGVHHYHFQVYALRRRPRLVEGSTPNEKVRAIRRAAIAGGQLVGTFER